MSATLARRGLAAEVGGSIVAGMKPHRAILITCIGLAALLLGSCRSGGNDASPPPPPDARRPTLKSEVELAGERAERLRTGEVVATEAPRIEPQPRPNTPPPRPEPILPGKDSIRSDILMVNNSALSVAEVLYPLRDWIAQARGTQTAQGFADQLRRQVRDQVRNEVGSLLVYEKALAQLPEDRHEFLDDTVDRELDKRVAREFGGSVARFENHLQRYGLTMEQAHAMLRRQLMVSSYTHETLSPQIRIRRDELLAYYRAHAERYSTEATRELRLIAAPYDKFLPAGVTWETAAPSARAQARLQAGRQIRAAHAALAERDFGEVAREYSRGVHAAEGGSWGQIGQPLRPPYEAASRRIFELEEGQYTEPIETETGWYIAQCGRVIPATNTPFAEVQEAIRSELESQRFIKLASDYIYRLAERATISDLDGFINSAVERAQFDWPGPPPPE
jgi:hypothetical protein